MRVTLNVIGIIIARIAYIFGIRKKVTLINLSVAYPNLPESKIKKIARKSYTNLGIVFAEMLYLRFANLLNIERNITVSNPDIFYNSLKLNKGLIVVAGHFSNWEWLALGGSLILKKNFAIVRKNIQASFTERFLEKMRMRSGNSLINSADIRKMYHALQSGGCLALLADQSAPGESVHVSFFGREVPTFEGPARLALRTKAPMLFAECFRNDEGNYIINFYPIYSFDLIGDSPENIRELTNRHTKILEEIIRQNPDQWLWQHRRWKYV